MSGAMVKRVYAPLLARARRAANPESRMKKAVDLIWNAFSTPTHPPEHTDDGHHHPAISWIGFYLFREGSGPDGADGLVLGPSRDKPACSPIGLHGVCGRCYLERASILVDDVATLGPNYIACDPNDRSELCIPLVNDEGVCWGVLDADSFQTAAFNEHDVRGMTMLCQRLGLTSASHGTPPILRL